MPTIIFDLGNVVIDIEPAHSRNAFTQLLQPYMDEADEADKLYDLLSFQMEVGAISGETMINRVQRIGQGEIMPEQVVYAWNAMLGPIPTARIELLQALKERYTTCILSNTDVLHMQWIRRHVARTFDIPVFDKELFHEAFMSYELKLNKPQPKIYEHVTKILDCSPDELFFIDDRLDNVQAAQAAGWQALQLNVGNDDILQIAERYNWL